MIYPCRTLPLPPLISMSSNCFILLPDTLLLLGPLFAQKSDNLDGFQSWECSKLCIQRRCQAYFVAEQPTTSFQKALKLLRFQRLRSYLNIFCSQDCCSPLITRLTYMKKIAFLAALQLPYNNTDTQKKYNVLPLCAALSKQFMQDQQPQVFFFPSSTQRQSHIPMGTTCREEDCFRVEPIVWRGSLTLCCNGLNMRIRHGGTFVV